MVMADRADGDDVVDETTEIGALVFGEITAGGSLIELARFKLADRNKTLIITKLSIFFVNMYISFGKTNLRLLKPLMRGLLWRWRVISLRQADFGGQRSVMLTKESFKINQIKLLYSETNKSRIGLFCCFLLFFFKTVTRN